ncbi:NUDIX domain-containing protein [Streptomyces sp. HB-N217]|uniref:NUDIX hydrolase n=1 Tax=Streptomyces sp. HB-N217 TaxID=2792016 RepID=UPI0018D88115|nr:NUDIX domain-containing protein [Streptomyces sp. HB-N217]MBH5135420.1 NUDIX domain-containing protein [Streptomyces sp. HB-N217]
MSSADEILDVVDENDRVVGRARRGDVYDRGLRHRCVFVWARDPEGRVFVHRRTASKLVFPALYDMFVGGVVGAGESYDDAALREAEVAWYGFLSEGELEQRVGEGVWEFVPDGAAAYARLRAWRGAR